MFKLDLEKGEEPEIKLPTSVGSYKKQENSRKTSTSASLTMLKSLTVWTTKKLWEILQEMGMPGHLTCLLQNLYSGQEETVRARHRTMDWFKNRERSMARLYTVALLNLSYMQNISCEMLGWMKHKLEIRLPAEMSITSDMQMTPP